VTGSPPAPRQAPRCATASAAALAPATTWTPGGWIRRAAELAGLLDLLSMVLVLAWWAVGELRASGAEACTCAQFSPALASIGIVDGRARLSETPLREWR
jgi:hypothetical protein